MGVTKLAIIAASIGDTSPYIGRLKGEKNMKLRFPMLLLAALLAAQAAAQTLTVEGVASPAWLERNGARLPLSVGMQLADRDKVVTGAGARALLRLAEGSAVKLGENAVLAVDDLADRRGPSVARLVTASLDVARGAFRFTTDLFSRARARRDVKVRISTITAGIRGTDVWGKSTDDRDIVCLIEGRIGVEHDGQSFAMADPLSFFIAPRKEKPLPVAPVDKAQLKQWAAETDIQPGSGGAMRGGKMKVNASVAPDQKTALRDYDRLRDAGFPAVIQPVRTDAGEEYRVRILNLPGLRDARAVVEKLKGLGMTEAQVSR
jgi:hypothetical protein